jgi:glycosyltransferase involved in cell wall biosynthesis
MKVFYSHEIFSRQYYGGISRYFYELYSRIQHKENTQAQILGLISINQYLRHDSAVKTMNETWARNLKLKIPLYVANCLVSKAQAILSACDIYHETYYPGIPYIRTTGKVVNTVHDMIPEKYPHSSEQADLIQRKRKAIKASDHIICVSENTKNDLLDFYPECAQRVCVVYHGGFSQDLTLINPDRRKNPYILYVGNRSEYKNFKLLIKAFALSDEIKNNFTLVAFGSTDFTQEERELFVHLKIADKIEYDAGSDDKLVALYKGAQVFVYPSSYEGFGMPILEAMACECPIICSNTSSLPEVGGQAVCYFDPTSPDDLRDKLVKVLFDKDYCQQLITLGVAQSKKFSWDKCANETYDIYKRL